MTFPKDINAKCPECEEWLLIDSKQIIFCQACDAEFVYKTIPAN